MDRRSFLRGIGAFGASAGLAQLGGHRLFGAKPHSAVHEVDGLPVASWVVEENLRRGSTRWVISPHHARGGIEGYVSSTSVQQGEDLTLYVNTSASSWVAAIYRIGYYGGAGGRLVHMSPELPGRVQPAAHFTRGINMVECHWNPSRTFGVTADWLPGYYLIRLVGSSGQLRYVPFMVRDDTSKAAIVVQSSVTTWQAYNPWGGYSLYGGPATANQDSFATRARFVSFDRPYTPSPLALDANGSGDFLGNEFPFVYLAERLGLDITYWTDVDFHERPQLLANHRCFVSLGHDEYWSTPMRDAAQSALHDGVNLAFLGANACYRQIRLQQSSIGPNRRVICYKDASEDPMTKINPALATGTSWATDPVSRPESGLIGVMYQSYGANAPLVVADASSFVFEGTGLSNNDRISTGSGANVIGSEFDGFEPRLRPAANVTILAHSPTHSVSGALASDMTYYSVPGGGAVFASGTAHFVPLLWNGAKAVDKRLSFGISKTADVLTKITVNVLRALSNGPASRTHPSEANWQHFYPPQAPVHLGVDVGGH